MEIFQINIINNEKKDFLEKKIIKLNKGNFYPYDKYLPIKNILLQKQIWAQLIKNIYSNKCKNILCNKITYYKINWNVNNVRLSKFVTFLKISFYFFNVSAYFSVCICAAVWFHFKAIIRAVGGFSPSWDTGKKELADVFWHKH